MDLSIIFINRKDFNPTLCHLIVSGCKLCWFWFCLLALWTELCTRSKVTGKFWTSCPHTSHVLFPFVLNHLIAHSSCTSLRAPLQLHSILSVFCSSHSSRHILHTASSSGISSSSASTGTGVIWSDLPKTKLEGYWQWNPLSQQFCPQIFIYASKWQRTICQ